MGKLGACRCAQHGQRPEADRAFAQATSLDEHMHPRPPRVDGKGRVRECRRLVFVVKEVKRVVARWRSRDCVLALCRLLLEIEPLKAHSSASLERAEVIDITWRRVQCVSVEQQPAVLAKPHKAAMERQ